MKESPMSIYIGESSV